LPPDRLSDSAFGGNHTTENRQSQRLASVDQSKSGVLMLSNDAHVRVMAAQRQQEAQAAARRSRIIAARRSKRKAEDTSRWIRRLLIAVR
jgi:hypothetical protein